MVDAHTRVLITDPGSWPEDEDTIGGQVDNRANPETGRSFTTASLGVSPNPLLVEKVNLCLEGYKGAYGKLPNAVLVLDPTMNLLRENRMVANWRGNPQGAYSGLALRTKYSPIRIYWESRIKRGEFGGTHKHPIYPLTLATQGFADRAMEFFRVGRDEAERFYNLLWCDVGVSRSQLEKEIERQLKK